MSVNRQRPLLHAEFPRAAAGGGGMKRSLATIGLGALAAVGLAAGLASGATQTPWVVSGSTGRGHTPVTICHKPGAPAEKTLVVDDDAVPGHLGHGDYVGTCNAPPPVDGARTSPGTSRRFRRGRSRTSTATAWIRRPSTCARTSTARRLGCPRDTSSWTGGASRSSRLRLLTAPTGDDPDGRQGREGGDDECEYPTTTTTDTTPTT